MLQAWLLLTTITSPAPDAESEGTEPAAAPVEDAARVESEDPASDPTEAHPDVAPTLPPEPTAKPIPRLFETLQGFRPSEMASHSNRKVTVTFIPGIQVRNELGMVSPFSLDRFGNEYREGPYSAGRVRINPVLRLGKRQNVDIVANVDFANGRWAPHGSSDPIVAEILDPNPATVAHGIPPVPTDLAYVDFRELYVQWNSKIGQLRLGQMADPGRRSDPGCRTACGGWWTCRRRWGRARRRSRRA
jgi:hypothetical protein